MTPDAKPYKTVGDHIEEAERFRGYRQARFCGNCAYRDRTYNNLNTRCTKFPKEEINFYFLCDAHLFRKPDTFIQRRG